MYAIITCQGFQYRVAQDEILRVPVFEGEEGSTISIDSVHLIASGDDVVVGAPTIPKAEVKAEVISHGRGKKVLVGKYKRRKDYRRVRGHRANYTELKIVDIVNPS